MFIKSYRSISISNSNFQAFPFIIGYFNHIKRAIDSRSSLLSTTFICEQIAINIHNHSSTIDPRCFRILFRKTRARLYVDTHEQLLRHIMFCKGRTRDIIRGGMYVPKWKTSAAPIIHFCTELSLATEIKLSGLRCIQIIRDNCTQISRG